VYFVLSCRIPQYYASGLLVTEKVVSIAALLGVHGIPNGQNPIRHLAMCLHLNQYVAVDDPSLETLDFARLSPAEVQVLLIFAKAMIEFWETAKFGQQEKYISLLWQILILE